ncbi:MAG: SUMF1/EgtB/PvdO family nonheme iron enzyme [Bacteroidetes bacterium]|nr:SUMF1/EgtB/PvdO family nonheme iron enzyme [Bacteroidota bacterium]MBI3482898.1 SUMF1/EgtB/PvdO family nonheme iron enzyme [Bacteroidota bacterium]
MKTLFVTCFVLFSFSLVAQPPAMLAVNKDLFADESEITIADWYVFMYSVVNEDIDYGNNDFNGSDFPSISMMPDTTLLNPYFLIVFRNANRGINSEYEGLSYKTIDIYSYRSKSGAVFVAPKEISVPNDVWDFPITGINFQQVKAYVMWRNAKLQSNKKEKGKWLVRLPSASEWENIARSAYELSLSKVKDLAIKNDLKQVYEGNGRNSKGCLLLNIVNDNPCENDKKYMVKARGGIFPAISFFANQYGLYCMQGNVSEMTSEQGIAVGGNFQLTAADARFNSKQEYKKPEAWLGFRCVAEKKKP